MNAVGIALVWCAVQVTLFALLAGAVYLVCRRWQPASGTWVTVAGLAGVLVLSAMALSPWPRWALVDRSGQTTWAASERAAAAEDAGATAATTSDAAGPSGEAGPAEEATPEGPSFAALFFEALADALNNPATEPEGTPRQWPAAAGALFLVAAGLGAVWLAAGLVSVGAYRARSRPIAEAALRELVDVLRAELVCRRPIELRQSDTLVTAATVGWRRPVVILPADWTTWTDDQRRAVLAHEIAHVRDRHFLGVLCGQLGLVLHFYHPLVHWLVHRLRLEQELAADAAAAGVMGGQREYLTAIAELALREPGRTLVWPARSFLPTRNMFLRRIAMLRDAKLQPGRLQPVVRWAVLGAVFACAVLVAGLRGPGERREAVAGEAAPAPEAAADEIDLSWVPADVVGIAAFRPAAIFGRPELEELRKLADERFAPFPGGTVTDLEQVAVVYVHKPDPAKRGPNALGPPLVMLRFTQADKAEERIATMLRDSTVKDYEGATYRIASQGGGAVFQPDERTIIVGAESDVRHVIRSRGGPVPEILGGTRGWRPFEHDHAVVAAGASSLAAVFAPMGPGFASPFAPLWEDAKRAIVGVRLDDHVTIHAVVACDDVERAVHVKQTVEALRVLARNYASQLRQELGKWPDAEPGMVASARALFDFATNASIRREGSTMQAEACGDIALLDFSKPFLAARHAAERTQSMNHVKQIGLAMHMFHDTYRRLPPAVLAQTTEQWQEAKPYSWRVALLPFLGQAPLYEQYRFDEPWDSPANLKVLEKMPDVYRAAGDPPDSTSTSYFVLVGPGTVFSEGGPMPRSKGVQFREIRDGMSNTLLVVEAKRSVPWTKPEDIPYDPAKPLPELGGHFEGGFLAALCDGSVRFLPKDLDEAVLRKLIEKADGQPVDLSKIRGPDPRRAAVRRALTEKTPEEPEKPVPSLAKVSGTITLDGTPLPGATIRLIPRAGGRAAVGVTDDSGKYVLTTFQKGDGAAPGTYAVTISAAALPGARSRVPKAYADAKTSPLVVEVAPGPNGFDFALKSE